MTRRADAVAPPASGSFELLGVRVRAMTAPDLHAAVAEAIRIGGQQIFAGHNLHSVYLYHRDPEMRRLYAQARNVFVDGMPLVWWGRALGLPLAREHRNTPIDWFPEVLTTAAREGWRVFYLGSTPEVAERGTAELRRRWPSLQLETRHGYFDMTPGNAEAEAVVARIREYRPHLLCLGMGMPRQEQWAARFASRTGANATLCLGALMELLAGELPVPPRWIGRTGLEWLFRLVTKPGRTSRRYLFEPWFLLPIALSDLASRRSRVLPELPPPPHP